MSSRRRVLWAWILAFAALAFSDLRTFAYVASSVDETEEVASAGGRRPRIRYEWQFPQAAGPELILVGRSNAGKSTLINALLQHYGSDYRARTSWLEGRTRSLDWYPVQFPETVIWNPDGSLTEHQDVQQGLCLVDCFGLGLVKYKLRASRLQSWSPLLLNYLSKRRALTAVLHLVSSEFLGELQDGDEELFQIFKRAVRQRKNQLAEPFRYIVVLTKCDLYEASEVSNMVALLNTRLKAELADVFHAGSEMPVEILRCGALADTDSELFVGMEEIAAAIDAAAARGWDLCDEWKGEMHSERKKGQRRTRREQKWVRGVYSQGRQQRRSQPQAGPKDEGKVTGQFFPESV